MVWMIASGMGLLLSSPDNSKAREKNRYNFN